MLIDNDTATIDEDQNEAIDGAESVVDDAGVSDDQASAVDAEQSDDDGDEGELVVTLGDEPQQEEADPAKAPEWLRDLRKANREKDRRIRELEQRLTAAAPVQATPTLGPKPKLSDSDFDEDKHEAALEAWYEQRSAVEAAERSAKEAKAKEQQQWAAVLESHNKAKAALKVPDYEDAEASVEDKLNTVQRAILIKGAKANSATMMYALGKNPKKLAELAGITDPVEFTWAVAQLETKLQVTKRKTAPVPERVVRGGSPGQSLGGVDKQLERLQAEAAKTGDRTKVHAYLRDKARQAA